jgi:hypothetical protein
MPIPYKTTKYGCQHRCGTRRRSSEKKAEMHEAICWSNPANKTCKSCENELYNYSDDGTPFRDCKDETAAIMIEQEYQTLLNPNSPHIKPIVNCPFWEPKS